MELKVDRNYDSWNKSVKQNAKLPGISPVLDRAAIDIAKGYVKWTYDVYHDILKKQAINDERPQMHVFKGAYTQAQLHQAERLTNSTTTNGGRSRGRGFDILIKQVIDEDRAKKRVSKGTKTQAQLNKAERQASLTTTAGGCGQGRGRDGVCGRGQDGHGRGSSRHGHGGN